MPYMLFSIANIPCKCDTCVYSFNRVYVSPNYRGLDYILNKKITPGIIIGCQLYLPYIRTFPLLTTLIEGICLHELFTLELFRYEDLSPIVIEPTTNRPPIVIQPITN